MFGTPWSFRNPSAIQSPGDNSPTIETVQTPDQLLEFDRIAAIGFDQPDADQVYSLPLLNDPRYRLLFIRQNNKIVAGVQSFTNDESIGIYTLLTLPDHRHQGFANALVRAALSHSPELPATTNPSDDSMHLFNNCGFETIGARRVWIRR
jgi:GNAT superfamily N-acetyltransferase